MSEAENRPIEEPRDGVRAEDVERGKWKIKGMNGEGEEGAQGERRTPSTGWKSRTNER